MDKFVAYFLLSVLLTACSTKKQAGDLHWIISAPAGERFTAINREGETIIPNGRVIKPFGKQITVAPHPFGLVISPDGRTIITSNSGVGPFSISIITDIDSENPGVRQIPEGASTDNGLLAAVFMGLAISPDNKTVYVAGGQTNKVFVFDIMSGKKLGEISCNKSFDSADYTDGYIGDMVMSRDGSRIYAVDQIGYRVVVIDVRKQQVIANVPTGRYPFGIALSPDEKNLFVANVGMFTYSYVKSLDPKHPKETALKFPATAYGSKEMKEGVRNDSMEVEGLGDPNVPESFSVWGYDLGTGVPIIRSKTKTGILVGEDIEGVPAVGGSSPNSIVATNELVFVSNGNNDNISVIDIRQQSVIDTITLQPDKRLGRLKGVIPFGVALSPDQRRLYVAEAGINAVGVIDVSTREVRGHIPAGWFPSKLKVSPDGRRLFVANAKGFGSGPNGGRNFVAGPEGDYIGKLMKGTVSIMDIPSDDQLEELTTQVVDNNFRFEEVSQRTNENPVPRFAVESTPIRHIVFISKENRTYDQVFGQSVNGSGDSTLAIYASHVSFADEEGEDRLEDVTVMPNHLALAGQFAMSDNFYVDADVSADGHRWLTNTYPNEWIETGHPAAYGGKRRLDHESNAPGKFGMTGSSGAIYPEDYNQDGSMWDHLFRNGKEFYNFGFGVEFGDGSFADSTFKQGGVRYLVNYPLPGPLFDRTSHMFPTFNMAIPDQYRADVFIQEVKEKWLDKNLDLPPVLTLQLPNDHGADERPHAGFPYHESYMADNDLAVGRVIEFLTNTPQWKDMLIVVTEDDAQGGNDHVDAHRSILILISPYIKRNYVSHRHASFGSIFKTFWNILGIPLLNQYDAGASDLSDLFTDKPDYTPYDAVAIDPRIFDPVKALTPLHEKFDWEAVKNSVELDDEDEIQKAREKDKRMKVKH